MKCTHCEDVGWVCEDHPEKPWEGPHACNCGAAGMPCPVCNVPPKAPRRECQQASKLRPTRTAGDIDGFAKRPFEPCLPRDGNHPHRQREAKRLPTDLAGATFPVEHAAFQRPKTEGVFPYRNSLRGNHDCRNLNPDAVGVFFPSGAWQLVDVLGPMFDNVGPLGIKRTPKCE